MAAEARLTFAAQAALLAKSQIAAWQMENAEAKWRIVGYLMNYSLAVQWQRERGGGVPALLISHVGGGRRLQPERENIAQQLA